MHTDPITLGKYDLIGFFRVQEISVKPDPPFHHGDHYYVVECSTTLPRRHYELCRTAMASQAHAITWLIDQLTPDKLVAFHELLSGVGEG